MNSKFTKRLRNTLIGVLLLCAFAAAGCVAGAGLRISCPSETIQAELGSYVLPAYEVVDAQGVIQTGYTVTVKSVTDCDGEAVDVVDNSIIADKTGVYSVVYTANSKGVADATLKLDFARRRPPTITVKPEAVPQYYVRGFSYRIPAYTLSDEPDLSKCYASVFYRETAEAERQEVTLTDGQFTVDFSTGVYEILIHAEDALGNADDRSLFIPAIGPAEVVDGRVLYFDQVFGEAQIKSLWNTFTYGFTGEKAFGDEAGSLKVVTQDVNDYLILDKLLLKDVSDYTHLVFHVYNDTDAEVYTGFAWFGDTVLAPRAWTEVKVSVAALETAAVNVKNEQKLNASDITGLSLRLWSNDGDLTPGMTFYVSNVDAVKEAVERDDDVLVNFGEAEMQASAVKVWYASGAYSAEQKVEGQAGSLKLTKSDTADPEVYVELTDPFIKDVTVYDYLTYSVYNPNDYAVTAGYKWCGDTVIQPGSWGEVRVPVSGLANIEPATTQNIIGLTMRFMNLKNNDSLYVSNLAGGIAGTLITGFGSSGLNAAASLEVFYGTGAFTDEKAYGEEQGSFKYVKTGVGEAYIGLKAPLIRDITAYDYVVYRVYNAGTADIIAGYKWFGDTTVAPGTWVDVKVNVADFKNIEPATATTSDITGLQLRFQNMADGSAVYISNLVVGMNA